MTLHSLTSLVAAIMIFVIGWSVLLRDRKHRQNVLFTILCFNICFWHLGNFFNLTFNNQWLFLINLFIGVTIPVNSDRFFRAFLAEDPRRPPPGSAALKLGTWLIYVSLLYAGFFSQLLSNTRFLMALCAFVFLGLYQSIYRIYVRRKGARSRPEAMRLTYLFYGGIATVTLAITDFLPRFSTQIPTAGNILTIIYMYFLSQALFHYRLLDIKELLGKMLTLSALVLLLTMIYGLLVVWVGRDQPGVFFFNTIVASFVILALFEPLRSWVEDRVTRWLFREKYEFSRRLRLMRREIANFIEVPLIIRYLLRELEESQRVTHVSIYLAEPTGGNYRLAGHVGPLTPDILESTKRRLFLERLRETGMLIHEALERELATQVVEGQDETVAATRDIISTMEDLHAGVCIPFLAENQLLGLINLRDDRLREAYARDELDELRNLTAQAAITLRNSQVFEQIKERDRLAVLGRMSAGLAHEIRNPLGAIKGAAQLLKPAPENISTSANKTTAEAETDEYLNIIIEEVNRLDRVVSQFLGYARPDRVERETVNINDVVQKTVQLLTSQAGAAQIAVELAPNLPTLRVDPEQMRQVFLNLGLNAIQATDGKGQVKIRTGMRRGQTSRGMSQLIEICFADNGKGISGEELENIFIPFFTTRDGGTGLGLPISQRIIESHKGAIEVHSQVGQGSMFSVLLPVDEDVTGSTATPAAVNKMKNLK